MLTSEWQIRSLVNVSRFRLILSSTLWTGLSEEVWVTHFQLAVKFLLYVFDHPLAHLYFKASAHLNFQFREPKELFREPSDEERSMSPNQITSDMTKFDEADLLFGSLPTTTNVSALHPQPIHIFRLWQTFLDNVNPLTNIIHAPTMQKSILEAVGDLGQVPRGLEALMFAIYAFAVTSLSPQDCENTFGDTRPRLLAKYRLGTQKALIRAEFLRSSDLVILQAFVLHLVSSLHHSPQVFAVS